MKKPALILFLLFSAVLSAAAQRAQTVAIRVGDQKTVAGKVHIHFLEVTDDSRCPAGTTCVWAGNAKLKLAVSIGKAKAREFDLNSNLDPRSIDYRGYRIKFVSLTEKPGPGKMTMVRPELVLSVMKIKR